MSCEVSETAHKSGGWRAISVKTWLACLTAIVVLAANPSVFIQAVMFSAQSLWFISPMILTGLLITAAMLASNSVQLIAKMFRGRELTMIVWVSLAGAITPVCGATVLPLIAGLLIARVPLAPVMAFWLASPVTDPAMLALTVGTLGWPLAIAKTLGAVVAGIFGGAMVLVLSGRSLLGDPLRPQDRLQRFSCSVMDDAEPVLFRFWRDALRRNVFLSSFKGNGVLMLCWLSIAFIAEFYMQRYVPLEWLPALFGTEAGWAVPLAAIVGAPVYLDGYAALPLVRGLIDAGMSAEAALTFLVAGGITSAWAAIPVFALVRGRVFILYLLLAVSASMLVGFLGGLFL